MNDFKNKPNVAKALMGKKIAVIGGGVEGLSSAKYLKNKGSKVTVLDQKDGSDYLKNLKSYDLIIRSPGVKLSDLEQYVSKDKITSQTKLFMDLCPCKVIGVTGTKGKGTTSSLIFEMLRKQDFDAYLGGNIGVSPFEFLDKLNTQSIVVLEMSSFQLEDITKSPHIGVILMIVPEHLGKDSVGTQNYHETMEDYILAKRNILKYQTQNDFAIVNRDYPASNESDIHTQGKIYYISREMEVIDGCFAGSGKIVLRTGGNSIPVVSTKDLILPGKHNYENVCAASLASYLAGVSVENISQVLKSFKGLEHRLELVTTIKGVKYYDDSFSTTPETAIAAILSFKNPEILILGGSSKNSNFEELGRVIRDAKNIKAIIGIGKEWEKIKPLIKKPKHPIMIIQGAKSMSQIVHAAARIAVSGDVVLLSPACASFDMFKNYKDRGDQFKNLVAHIKENESN